MQLESTKRNIVTDGTFFVATRFSKRPMCRTYLQENTANLQFDEKNLPYE